MRLLFALLVRLVLAGSGRPTTEVLVGDGSDPAGAILLVVDGMGANYVYPELEARAIDGSPLGSALLFNLTGEGARVLNVTVPVPETGPSHSVLVSGCSWVDPTILGTPEATIFDLARETGLVCLAVLQRGDAISMVLEQDALLFFDDNSLWGAEPLLGCRADIPVDLVELLQAWRDRFPQYNRERGVPGYVGYNAWGLDVAAAVVSAMGSKSCPFLLLVNVGAVDSAGHNLGPKGYVETISGLDAPLGRLIEACESNNVVILITADHGMSFPAGQGKGGHSSAKYSSRTESVMVPAVFMGPGVDDLILAGNWSEMDLAPTILYLLGLETDLPLSEGQIIPVSKCFNLEVDAGKVTDVEVRRDGDVVARATGDSHYIVRNLERGSYSVESGGRGALVFLNGDQSVDFARGSGGSPEGVLPLISDRMSRRFIAAILILAINVAGAVLIFRVVRRN